MAEAKGGDGKNAVVELCGEQDRYLDDLIRTIHKCTEIELTMSDVIRSLVDLAMEDALAEADVEAECRRARTLAMLLDTRREIESEMRQTEFDLNQTLIHDPDGGDTARNFRRNLRYQRDRLKALEEQVAQFRTSDEQNGKGTARLVRALLARRFDGE